MARLFCYGTLNLHSFQTMVWGEQMHGKVQELQNHKLGIFDSGYFYVDKEFGESVAGKVYKLTDEQLEATDKYEGPSYERSHDIIDGHLTYFYKRKRENES